MIVQNFRAKPDTAMRHVDDLGLAEYRAAIAVTRLVLGPKARVQAPPNLVDSTEAQPSADCCSRPASTTGAASPRSPPTTSTPSGPWPSLDRLRELTAECGFELKARLTVHPEYVVGALQRGEPWLDPRVAGHVAALAGPDGLAIPGVKPTGLPWQEPDGGFESLGRTDLHAAVDTEGRTDDRRGDFTSVYGDWDEVKAAAADAAPVVSKLVAALLAPPPAG